MSTKLDFVKRNGNYFALIICLIFLITAFFSVQGKFWDGLKFSGDALTSDEVSHIPAGFYYLKTHQYFINTEHPYLIKDIAALPLLFLNLNFPEIPEEQKYENIQWQFGSDFLFNVGNDPDLITLWSRLSIILFNTLLLFLVYYFLKKIFGTLPSLIAIFFLTFSPNVIAHSSLVVLDAPLSFLCLLSILTFSLFLKELAEGKGGWAYFFLAAFFTSLALATKFQALFLLVAIFLGGFFYILIKKRGFLGKYFLLFIFSLILILTFIGAIYGFHTENMETEGIQRQIEATYPHYLPSFGKNLLFQAASSNFFCRGLTEYLAGTFMITGRAVGAFQTTYFMKAIYGSEGAGLAYFPILFLTKETLGFLIFLFLAILLSVWSFFKNCHLKQSFINFFKNPFNITCLSFIVIYALFSLTLRLNIGLRHIFPITFLVYVLVAKEISKWLPLDISIFKKPIKLSLIFLPVFILIICSWALAFPHYLSFYNPIGGGIDEGYKIATDSNYDWGGQDVKRLGKWIKDNKIEKIYAHIFTNVPLEYYLGEAYQPYNIKYDPLPPANSYLAVSAFEMQNINYDKGLPESKKYFQFQDDLIKRVGPSIFVFKIK